MGAFCLCLHLLPAAAYQPTGGRLLLFGATIRPSVRGSVRQNGPIYFKKKPKRSTTVPISTRYVYICQGQDQKSRSRRPKWRNRFFDRSSVANSPIKLK